MIILPSSFADLASFTAWALPTETARNHHRIASTQADITAFAAAMIPRLDDITAYLNDFALDAMPADARHLFHMLLSVAEIAPAIEFYRQPTVTEGYDSRRFRAQEHHPLRPAT